LLLCLVPCTLILFVSFLQAGNNEPLIKAAAGLSLIISILSTAMLLDMVLVALKFFGNPFFQHPFWDGFMIFYGLGNFFLGLLIIMIAVRYPGGISAVA
jgi:hypothetical protein